MRQVKLHSIIVGLLLAGCMNTPKQLPSGRATQLYRYIFWGIHRPLSPDEDSEVRKLFVDYVEAEQAFYRAETDPHSGDPMKLYDPMWSAELAIENWFYMHLP